MALLFTVPAAALESSIIERGSESSPEVGLWVRNLGNRFGDVNQLVSPSGQVFAPASILENGFFSDLVIRFKSLTEAMDYVEGDWQATVVRGSALPSLPPPATQQLDFSIGTIAPETISGVPPTLLTPAPDALIKNGSTFNFGWDYVTSGGAPRRSLVTVIPQFDPISSGSRWGVSTPTPSGSSQGSGGTGTGDRKFSHTHRTVPGTNQNRFLVSFTATAAALPLDVEMTLGSYVPLEAFVDDGSTFSPGFPSSSSVSFFYSRQNDPFIVTLNVPEPSSASLVMACLLIGSMLLARHVGVQPQRSEYPTGRQSLDVR